MGSGSSSNAISALHCMPQDGVLTPSCGESGQTIGSPGIHLFPTIWGTFGAIVGHFYIFLSNTTLSEPVQSRVPERSRERVCMFHKTKRVGVQCHGLV